MHKQSSPCEEQNLLRIRNFRTKSALLELPACARPSPATHCPSHVTIVARDHRHPQLHRQSSATNAVPDHSRIRLHYSSSATTVTRDHHHMQRHRLSSPLNTVDRPSTTTMVVLTTFGAAMTAFFLTMSAPITLLTTTAIVWLTTTASINLHSDLTARGKRRGSQL